MELYKRLEQILQQLRPVFSREASFGWFVLLVWGIILNTQGAAITSYLNALGLGEDYYAQALHWFRASSLKIDQLCQSWGEWLRGHENVHRLKGQQVYVGDGIKVGKEGRKMPGVKRLHQESGNVSKPEWIRGHYFSALALLLGSREALFAVPITLKLHDGIKAVGAKADETVVEKMAELCVELMPSGSYALLDAYYGSAVVLKPFRTHGLHLISRVKISTTAYPAFCRRPGKHGPGQPRQWGTKVKLRELFAGVEQWPKASLWLYGKRMTVAYQCVDLFWDSPNQLVRFVLTQLPNGKQIILLSSDIRLTGPEIIEAYGWRFKIEVSFRTLIHLLGGFGYRFWLKSMQSTSKWPDNLHLSECTEDLQLQVSRKVEAFERFINIHAIVLGLLQILALELPQLVWTNSPGWFRTLPKHGFPSEKIVQLSLQHLRLSISARTMPALLLAKLLVAKSKSPRSPDFSASAA